MHNNFTRGIIVFLNSIMLIFTVQISGIDNSNQSDFNKPEENITTDPSDPLANILLNRYSSRSFDPTMIVTHDQLKTILAAGQLTPSSFNEQPWYFIVCDRITNPEAYDNALATLVPVNQKWAKNSNILIIIIVSTKSAYNGKPNKWAQYDTGAAAFSMMLQANSLGIMATEIGGFDADQIKERFTIPEDFSPMAVMAVAYAASGDVKPPKKRKPLQENFYNGVWGLGFE